MTTYSLNDIKNGMKLIIDGDPCTVLENEFVKPGKGQAFNRLRYRHIKSGRVIERTYKSSDALPAADVTEVTAQLLYQQEDEWHFMANDTFEQYAVPHAVIGDAALWITPKESCTLTIWNNTPIAVTPANFVLLRVTLTDPGLKGDTAGSGGKAAHLETKATVRVPLFIQEGDLLKVDTRTGTYVARVKE